MPGDKLNTAEYDSRGRCIRHSAVRLRKKKLLGGWKVIIGHCPECCLDEMRRVRDQIEANDRSVRTESSGGGGDDTAAARLPTKKKKKKKSGGSKSEKDRGEGRRHRSKSGHRHHHDNNSDDGNMSKGDMSAPVRRGEADSAGTGSTQPDSMQGSGETVSSEQHVRNYGIRPRAPEAQYRPPPPPPGGERTMVLSMALTDRTTGHRGSYTGQIDTATGQPDGKGTVYYNDGSLSEGTWSNGVLVDDSDGYGGRQQQRQNHHQNQHQDGYTPSDNRPSRPQSRGRGAYVPPPPRNQQYRGMEGSQESYNQGGHTSDYRQDVDGYTSESRRVRSSSGSSQSRRPRVTKTRATTRGPEPRGPEPRVTSRGPAPRIPYQAPPSDNEESRFSSSNYMPGSLSDLDRMTGGSKTRSTSVQSNHSRNSYASYGAQSTGCYSENNNNSRMPPSLDSFRDRGGSVHHQSPSQPYYGGQETNMDP